MLAYLPAVTAEVMASVTWPNLADPGALLQGLGGWALAAVAVMVFVESGVLFPFLPGDSLIFTAGLLHTQLGLNLMVLIAVIVIAAVLGDQVGYWLGRRFGRRLFTDNARVLKTRNLISAENFFTRYGGRSLVLARFVPFARTFVPLAAGTASYRYRSFMLWNALGAVLWAIGLTIAGSLLGGIPFIAAHVDVIALVIVAISVVPAAAGVFRHVRRNRAETVPPGASTAVNPVQTSVVGGKDSDVD